MPRCAPLMALPRVHAAVTVSHENETSRRRAASRCPYQLGSGGVLWRKCVVSENCAEHVGYGFVHHVLPRQ